MIRAPLAVTLVALSLAGMARAQDPDQDGVLSQSDNCPFWANALQFDSDGDGIGDACQCGDVDQDGLVRNADVDLIRAGLVGTAPLEADLESCNVTGPVDRVDRLERGAPDDCDILDAVLVARASAGDWERIEQVCTPALPLLQAIPDIATESRVLISPTGGSLVAERAGITWTLTIPSGALVRTTEIGLVPLTDLLGLPVSTGAIAPVSLEPGGTLFLKPVTLTIEFPDGFDTSGLVGLTARSSGQGLHLILASVAGSSASFELTHFSPGAGTKPTAEEKQKINEQKGVDGLEKANREATAAAERFGPNSPEFIDAMEGILVDWLNGSVLPDLSKVPSNKGAAKAIAQFLAWRGIAIDQFDFRTAAILSGAAEGLAGVQRAFERWFNGSLRSRLSNPTNLRSFAEAVKEFRTWGRVAEALGFEELSLSGASLEALGQGLTTGFMNANQDCLDGRAGLKEVYEWIEVARFFSSLGIVGPTFDTDLAGQATCGPKAIRLFATADSGFIGDQIQFTVLAVNHDGTEGPVPPELSVVYQTTSAFQVDASGLATIVASEFPASSVVAAVAVIPQSGFEAFEDVIILQTGPDMVGAWSGMGSETVSFCECEEDNGTFSGSGTLSVTTQTGGSFSGTISGVLNGALNGTVAIGGSFNAFTSFVEEGTSGTATVSGQVVSASSLTFSHNGSDTDGCVFFGGGALSR